MNDTAHRYARTARDWFSPPLLWVVGPLAIFVVAFSFHLWPEWNKNPDLSHGMFAPLIFALLIWEGVRTGTQRWVPSTSLVRIGSGALIAGAAALFALGGLLAASVGWTHAIVNLVLAASLAAALIAGLLVLASDQVRAVPCNWPILTAIGLWLLVANIPPGTYSRLTLSFQGCVTTGVLHALHFLGVPARQIGNVIELANTSVGVEEACSGIRSLLSCLYAGFFFAAWLVRSTARRVVLIALAPLLAIGMNYVRSLSLTLMANAGIDISGFWHDATGFAILGLTAATLAGLAVALETGTTVIAVTTPMPNRPTTTRSHVIFASGSFAIIALAAFFYSFSRPVVEFDSATVPADLVQLLPKDASGWQVVAQPNLSRFAGILQTNHLAERTYVRMTNGQPVRLNAYIAHWEAGRASVSLVASHTPDACWPGSGWEATPNAWPQTYLEVADHRLPLAEYRIFQRGAQPQHVWFWHIYDGKVINYRAPYSIPALVEIALRYGFRRQGAQTFVRFSSNRPWEELQHDPLVQQIFSNFRQLGLHQ